MILPIPVQPQRPSPPKGSKRNIDVIYLTALHLKPPGPSHCYRIPTCLIFFLKQIRLCIGNHFSLHFSANLGSKHWHIWWHDSWAKWWRWMMLNATYFAVDKMNADDVWMSTFPDQMLSDTTFIRSSWQINFALTQSIAENAKGRADWSIDDRFLPEKLNIGCRHCSHLRSSSGPRHHHRILSPCRQESINNFWWHNAIW